MPQIYSKFIAYLNIFMYLSLILIVLYYIVNIILAYFLILKNVFIDLLYIYLNSYIYNKIKKNIFFLREVGLLSAFIIRDFYKKFIILNFKLYSLFNIIRNFFFSIKKFSTWQFLKNINDLILQKNIFYKFFNKKNPFNSLYKNKKIKYLNWFWKIRN
jgi:hypothetical protein